MTQPVFENTPFEVILQTPSQTILSSLSTDCLKLRISKKLRSSSQLTSCAQYQCMIKQSEITEKLHQYFESLKELNDYLSISDNVKIDWDKRIIDIVAKGPTKKSSYMLLAQFKLNRIQKFGGINKDASEEWIDHLAGQIIGIIESKSRIKDRADTQKQFVSKQEMQTAIQNMRKQLLLQLQKTRQEVNTLKQKQQQHHKYIQSHETTNLTQPQHQHQQKQPPKLFPPSQPQQQQFPLPFTQIQQQLQHLQKQIQQLSININDNKYQLQLQLELSKIQQNLRNQIHCKFMEFVDVFSKKEEMDTVIRKIQSLGTKVENIMVEAEKKLESGEILQSKLSIQEKKLSQIQVKLGKDRQEFKSIETSPKKTSAECQTPGNPMMVQNWIDQSCSHFGRVSINKSTITMNSYGNARIFSRMPIIKTPVFNIYINQISKIIAIGVIDSTYKQSVIMGQQPNTITYQNDRKFYNGIKEIEKKGQGFNKNDIVTVVVDIQLGTILWKVGNKLCYSWQSDLLRNNKIAWVPFIKMFDKGDKVQLVQ